MIEQTLKAAGFNTRPYHTYVPSFGDWGFMLVSPSDFGAPNNLPEGLRYYVAEEEARMFGFPQDMRAETSEINRLSNQALVRRFTNEWRRYGYE